MDYNEQRGFLKEYRNAAIAFSFLAVSVEAMLMGGDLFDARKAAVNSVLTLGLIYSIIYVPKYLNLTIEPLKKYSWNFRMRWILMAALFICCIAAANERDEYRALVIGGLPLIITNFGIRSWFKKRKSNTEPSHWCGTIYAVIDALALYLIFDAFKTDQIVQTLVCAMAAHLAIQLNASFLSIAFLGSVNCQTTPEVILFIVFASASYGFAFLSRRRNEQNLEKSVAELAAFDGKDRETVKELLATSTGKLAADWREKNPQGKQAVEAWYGANSEYYIYDLAQYHLAYKHIVFSLNVIDLSQGRVLDYGAGIGDLALAISERGHSVTYFDVEGKSKQFARRQAERRGLDIKFASSHAELETDKFDTIIALDVLEHLFEPQQTLNFLLDKLSEGGLLIASAYFGATKAHPMHFDHNLDLERLLAEHGLSDAKGINLRLFGSEAMRRRRMFVYRKTGASSPSPRTVLQQI